MKIYTKTGDDGRTGLFGGQRVSKTHPRVEAYGAVDELNASLGLAAAFLEDEELRGAVRRQQSRLFDLGADLATPPDTAAGDWLHRVPSSWVRELETEIDALEADLPPLHTFIVPGGHPGAAGLHVARTICRRAERLAVAALEAGEAINEDGVRYLNRLSDWLFVTARAANARAGVPDRSWEREL